ncbi:MAG: hypothetical protein COT18_06315, partial [Elusimicrobia bacterium CG08_land_8_20_14_0_20_59_10]
SGSSSGAPGGKLAKVASISGGGNNSRTAGGSAHNKFFGSGNQKAAFAKPEGLDTKKEAPAIQRENKGPVNTSLQNALEKSKLALKSPNSDSSRNDATTAFSGGSKGLSTSELGGKSEESSAVSGLELGAAAGDLKKNDPSLNKHK